MNSKKISAFLLFAALIGGVIYFASLRDDKQIIPAPEVTIDQTVFDAKNASYEIDGTMVTLVNGEAQSEEVQGSVSRNITRYFGNEAKGDLNTDGEEDTAFLITQDKGGSGLFYYAVAVLKTANGYETTNTFFIGDRIAPQSNNIMDGKLYIHYAERNPGEPMTVQPSLGAEKILRVTSDSKLIDLAQ